MAVSAPSRVKSAVTDYAERVIGGEIVAGKYVRLACERHLADIKDGKHRGLTFDSDKADAVIRFFGKLQHSKGEWAGQPLVLEPWQKFIVGSLFGWMRADGTRRFRISYTEIARKNGKSITAAAVGLYLAFFDGEPGAEVYAAATKRDQAKIVWGDAHEMVRRSPDLKRHIKSFVGNLHSTETRSKFEPLGADADNMDGLNIHGVIIDELHAHKTRSMFDVLQTATGARRQPLTFIITTAGYDQTSICWEQHEYGTKILEGIIEDDAYFVYIAALDEGDDWRDLAVWPKANPNYGVSVNVETLTAAIERAKAIPGEQNAVLRLNGGVWTNQESRWLDMQAWDECGQPFDLASMVGRECYLGLDLSWTTDLTSAVLVFPVGDEVYVIPHFWIPRAAVSHNRGKVPYEQWEREGYVKVCDGAVVDYDVIRSDINALAGMYTIREVAIDPWNARQIETQLMGDGFTVVEIRQGFPSLTAPTKELGNLVAERQLRHGSHPLLRWNASNVSVAQDAAGNIKPVKPDQQGPLRIDGIAALVNALARSIVATDQTSIYEERGVLAL